MNQNSTFLNLFFFLAFCVLFVYIMKLWANLIIPFIIAILFSFAIIWLSNFYKKFKLPSFLALFLSILTYIFIFWVIWEMINSNIQDVIKLMPIYQEKIQQLYISLLNYFKIPQNMDLYSLFQKVNLASLFSNVIWSITSLFSSAWLIFFYVIFILLEYRFFWDKLNLMFEKTNKKTQIFETIEKIKKDIKSYFLIKTVVSFITAFLSYIVMIIVWLDFSLFWAMVIFFLNFIPNIGSVIAVSFPIMLSLIQYDTYYPFLFILFWLVWVQILMGNIIEPRFMWNKLNLSPLIIIISLWFWWAVWWVIGMLLSVPLMVILNIILAKIPQTRPLAILLSEKWVLDVYDKEKLKVSKKNIFLKIKNKIRKI